MTEGEGYNGWSNYETWCVHLWATSDNEKTYRYWMAVQASHDKTAVPHRRRSVHDEAREQSVRDESRWIK
jgi:hypothetical protein